MEVKFNEQLPTRVSLRLLGREDLPLISVALRNKSIMNKWKLPTCQFHHGRHYSSCSERDSWEIIWKVNSCSPFHDCDCLWVWDGIWKTDHWEETEGEISCPSVSPWEMVWMDRALPKETLKFKSSYFTWWRWRVPFSLGAGAVFRLPVPLTQHLNPFQWILCCAQNPEGWDLLTLLPSYFFCNSANCR